MDETKSLEERIHEAVETALADTRLRVERDIRAIVQDLRDLAADERELAAATARRVALEEAADETKREVAAAEARVRESLDATVNDARQEERERAALEVRKIVEFEADQRLTQALANADQHMKLALLDADTRARQQLTESVTAARVREREAELAGVTRLLDSIRGLDGAASLSEVLDALGQAVSRETARCAVMVLRSDRLLGWKLSGFGQRDAQPKSIDLGLTESGVLGLAVGSARPVTTRDTQSAAEGPGFAHLPHDRMGLAVPVIVGGRVVAVVYADGMTADGREQQVPSGWPEVVEILARHAARCLEALTVQKASTSPSPRFWVPPGGRAATQTGTAPAPARPAGGGEENPTASA